ncbi:PKD domain-containing protein [Flaviaesturariibacter flavus]|uniref:PKD domain-containing protein n=1 Tax=Flaviaesturariibacter flavus TaxID=2502780 RepID=A0A4R1BB48_9BACT|nr:PKD-like domain-containing protein [Flaviaesturariibacter flavus]TCJ14215.1 PKD domain-containing protein [Flaviaesturariibacter flavus]
MLAVLLLCSQCVMAQTPYTYTVEGFEDVVFPTTAPTTETPYTSATGTWRLFKGNAVTGTDPCPVVSGNRALRLPSGNNAYLISPKLNNGAGVITFKDGRSNRTFTISTSTDDGATWTVVGTIGASTAVCAQLSRTINDPLVNRVRIANLQSQDAGIDSLLITSVAVTAPVVTTTAATAITFTGATSGGNVTSDGLAAGGVTARGIVWATSTGPTIASNLGITTNGTGTGAFSGTITGLVPGVTYYYRAYATNSVGTSYGAELTFTTPVAVPTLTATPATLDFGNQTVGTTSGNLSYSLSGVYLSPAAGNITVTAPAGFSVSTNPNGPFGATASVPYTGSTLAATTIYVRFTPAVVGAVNANAVNTGGGVAALNVGLAGSGAVALPGTTNVGFDFWTGFGYQEKMNQPAGDADEAKLCIYISVPSGTLPANVRVELPGIPGAAGFPQVVTVTPGAVTEVTNFPTGSGNQFNTTNAPDTRLYYTGVSNRGIHIYSTNGVPISVWMHSYNDNNSAAGAMLFPTNTWASSYTVQAYGGYSNNRNPNSFFFIVAKEDNTPVWFKPSQDVLDSMTSTLFTDGHTAAMVKYHQGVEYGPLILNKGQVFNAMGFIQGTGSGITPGKAFGLDLSGSTVRTNCDKSIAVFGGNGRVLVNAAGCSASSGSDHMIQQMFPSVAWGKRYLTAPTVTMEYNVYRINVSDPATQVWVNDPSHTAALNSATLVNNLYYEIASNVPQLIESDKPITVTQFIVAEGCATANGSKGNGDPEMIILSPVEQAINNTTVYSAGIKRTPAVNNGHYINVIIRTGGVASFRLDGATTGDPGIDQSLPTTTNANAYDAGTIQPLTAIFKPHPQLAGYSYAQLRVAPNTSHTLYSDSAFNAIAYGMGDGESYGYNAGASLKDLSQFVLLSNPYGVTGGLTCKGNDFYFRIAVPYAPADLSSLTWNFYNNPALTPNANVVQNNPTPDSTFSVDGVPYYVYRIATPYQFSAAGTYDFQVAANAVSPGGCTGVKLLNNSVTVKDGVRARFNPVLPTCGARNVQFNDVSFTDSTTVARWNWNFGDGATLADTSHQKNPTYTYPAGSSYTVSLRAINEAGCYADTTRSIDLSGVMTAAVATAPATTICAGSSVTFTNNSTASGTYGTIGTGPVDFGDGQNGTIGAGASVSHTYALPGTYTVTYQATTSNSCTQNSTPITITVNPVPAVSSAATGTICNGNAQNYTVASSVTGSAFSWSRAAVAGISNAAVSNQTANPITEALVNTTNAPIVVTYTITASAGGCTSAPFTYSVTVYPAVAVTSSATGTVCSGAAQNYAITTNVPGATLSWSRVAVPGISNAAVSGQTTGTITEALVNTTNAPVAVTYSITPSLSGCTSTSFSYTVTVNPTAFVSSAATSSVCSGAAQNYAIAGSVTGSTFSWGRAAVAGISNAAVSGQATGTITEALVNTTNAPVAAVYTIVPNANGCSGTPFTYTVTVNPTATVSSAATAQVCSGTPFAYSPTSAVAGATFAWSRAAVAGVSNAAATGTGNIAETLTNTTAAPVVVTYVVTPSAGACAGTPMNVVVTINPTPTAGFTFANNSCTTSPVNFAAVTTGTITGYSWNFGVAGGTSTQQNPTFTYTAGGTYNVTLTVTSASGCTATSTPQAVTVAGLLAAPVVTFDTPGPNVITFRWNAVAGATGYEVSVNGSAFAAPNGAGGLSHTVSGLQPNTPVNITVRAIGALTCQASTGTATATTMMPDTGVFVPNTFSPNGDGHNDVLKVYSNYIAAIDMRVFNQWGQQIFSSTDPAKGWDGTSKGRMQPVGVYVYVIKVTLQNGTVTTEKGVINLIR